jgi:drug/metabolite transporter, DME family
VNMSTSVQGITSGKGAWFIIASAMLWGTTGTSQALAPAASSPQIIGAVRLLVGGLALALIALSQGGLRQRRNWPVRLTLIAGFFVAAYQLCFFWGVSRTGVAIGTIVGIGSSPIFAGLLEYVFQKRKAGPRWIISTSMAIMGCSLLLMNSRDLQVDSLGILLAAAAGFSYAAYTQAMKLMLPGRSAEDVTAVVFCTGALLLSPLLFTADLHWLTIPRGWLLMLHLGVVATGLAYWLFVRGLEHIPVSSAVTLSLAEPMTAAVLGVVVVGERLSGTAWCGLALILSGLFVLVLPKKVYDLRGGGNA